MAGEISGLAAAGALVGSELMEISQLSATVTITAATISAQASDNSYNDSGSGFVAAGFAVGDRVNVSGFTGDTANNILVGVVTALTTGKMTIGGTDGDVIVDDAAGESVTISKWVSRRFGLASLPKSYDFGTPYYSGQPTANEVLARIPIARDIVIDADFLGAFGAPLDVNPDNQYDIDVQDDGVSIGTISISDSGVYTFTTAGGTAKNVAAGSVITVIAPGTADASIDGIQVGFKAREA